MKAIVALVLVVFVSGYFVNHALATEMVKREGTTLTVYEQKAVYEGVPKAIPDDIALQMIAGKVKMYDALVQKNLQDVRIGFPVQLVQYSEVQRFSYEEEKWIPLETFKGVVAEDDNGTTFLWVYLVMFLLVIIGLKNRLGGHCSSRSVKKACILFAGLIGGIFCSILLIAALSALWGPSFGGVVVAIIDILALIIYSAFIQQELHDGCADAFAGFFAFMWICIFASSLPLLTVLKVGFVYSLFLAGTFFAALLVGHCMRASADARRKYKYETSTC